MNGGSHESNLGEVLTKAGNELCFPGSDDHVVKAEISAEGVIQVELSLSHGRCWYEWTASGFRELKPVDDRKIPLAACLEDKNYKWRVKVLAYRPGKRLTLLDQSGEKPRIVKGFRKGRLDGMIERYERAHEAMSGRGVQAPEITDYDRPNEALIMAYQDGDPLHLAPETTDLFQMAGEALQAFQGYHGADEPEPFSARDELAVIDERRRRLQVVGAPLPHGFFANRERLERTHTGLPAPLWGWAHRDLHDLQFIQKSNHLALLDFDLMARADTTLDAGNFLAHLVLRQMQGVRGATQRGVDQSGRKFLQGLDRTREPGFWRRLRFYQATTFSRLALVYLVRPRWVHLVVDLLQMSNRCIDDFERIEGA